MKVLEAIRRVNSHHPVIVVSAYGDKRTRQEAAQRGADGFFQKRANVAKLYRQMRILLAMHSPHQLEAELSLQTEGRQAQLIAQTRRLNKLKERQALLGIDAPPELLIEIEDLEGEIKRPVFYLPANRANSLITKNRPIKVGLSFELGV
ncbi:MAG: hypothetical protein BroJett011_34050 [Chloroflexota bacterium]|nr:MAG: hypothetical protein BroJett011_34050 [Chloroflexota bacterium]